MIEFRQPAEEDRTAIMELVRLSFPVPASHVQDLVSRLRLGRYLGAYDRGRLVATAQVHPLQQWFGGQPVPCAGIASVATEPERRGMGIASSLMREALFRERERGVGISTLYPATVPVYRRLGYEYAGTYTQYTAKLRSLPVGAAGGVEAFEEEDPRPLRECFRRLVAGNNGVVDCDEDDWWPRRILRRGAPEVVAHTVVVPGADGIDGYAAFTREDTAQQFGFRLACTHLVAMTRSALEALLGYFRRFQGIGRELRWQGPPNETMAFLLPEQSLEPTFTFRFMTRILDVKTALEGRGYPDVAGEATIALADDLFPENSGTYSIGADAGKVVVERTEGKAASIMPIGVLGALYTGYVTPEDLVRMGHLQAADPGLPILSQLFGGPPPWMPDFF